MNSVFVTLCLFHSNRSDREVRGAGLVLQNVWGFKELRRTLEKDGWKKSDFVVNVNPPNARTNGGYEDSSTLPLIDRGVTSPSIHFALGFLYGSFKCVGIYSVFFVIGELFLFFNKPLQEESRTETET